jgi:hypothetical protein
MTLETGASVDRVERVGSVTTDAGSMAPPRQGLAKRALSGLGLVALAASALVGGNAFGLREQLMGSLTPEALPAAVSRGGDGRVATVPTQAEPQETVLRSQPWWQGVTTLEGTGATTTDTFAIADGAIQWRVTATCETGELTVKTAEGAEPLLAGSCGTTELGYGTQAGATSLLVEADGPWKLQVDQQLDVPLVEPPTPAMTAAGTVTAATGEFYRIDQAEKGDVTIYRLEDGSHALRLDDFYVTPNIDLEIHLSPLEAPQTTEEFMSAPSVRVAPLDVTTGSMNFTVPPDVDPAQYRSVVIWCPLINSAYAAASLAPAS